MRENTNEFNRQVTGEGHRVSGKLGLLHRALLSRRETKMNIPRRGRLGREEGAQREKCPVNMTKHPTP